MGHDLGRDGGSLFPWDAKKAQLVARPSSEYGSAWTGRRPYGLLTPNEVGYHACLAAEHLSLGTLRLDRGTPIRRLSVVGIDSGAVTRALYGFSESIKTSFKVNLLWSTHSHIGTNNSTARGAAMAVVRLRDLPTLHQDARPIPFVPGSLPRSSPMSLRSSVPQPRRSRYAAGDPLISSTPRRTLTLLDYLQKT